MESQTIVHESSIPTTSALEKSITTIKQTDAERLLIVRLLLEGLCVN